MNAKLITSIILARGIYREGSKLVAAGGSPMAIKRGIDKAVALVVENSKKCPNRYWWQITATGCRGRKLFYRLDGSSVCNGIIPARISTSQGNP